MPETLSYSCSVAQEGGMRQAWAPDTMIFNALAGSLALTLARRHEYDEPVDTGCREAPHT